MEGKLEDKLKISVVLPVYNCEKWISRSIRSVLRQTYSNWELIIVNDGSSDASGEIARKFVKADKRIKLIQQENQGVSVARNHGMDETAGELLMFLDADDWFENRAFETVVDHWDNDMDMLLFDYYDVPEKRKRRRIKYFTKSAIIFGKDGEYSIGYLKSVIVDSCKKGVAASWGRVYKTEYLKQKRIRFSKEIFIFEDGIFNLNAIEHMRKAVYLSIPLYNYYINSDSVMMTIFTENGKKMLDNMIRCDAMVKEIFCSSRNPYENAYYKYVLREMKLVLWWTVEERDKKKRNLGRKFCYQKALLAQKHMNKDFSLQEKVLIILCVLKGFGLIEMMVGYRKKLKRLLSMR